MLRACSFARIPSAYVARSAARFPGRCLIIRQSLSRETWKRSDRGIQTSRRILCSRGPAESVGNKFTWKEFKKYVKLAYPERYVIGCALICLGINAACNLIIPYGMGRTMDSSLDGAFGDDSDSKNNREKSRSKLYKVAGGLFAVFCIGSAAMFLRVSLLNIGAERIMRNLRQKLFSSLTRQEAGFYDKNRTGELINRLSSDTVVISRTLTDSIASGLRRVVEGTGGVAVLLYLTPKLTMLMLSVVPAVAIGGVMYGRFIRKLSKEVQDSLGKTTELAEESLSSIRTVKLFANEQRETARYAGRVEKVYELGKRSGIYSGSFYGAIGLAGNLSMLSVLTYGGSMVIDNQISIGDLTSFLLYSVYVAFALSGSANSYNDICKGLGATERVFELIDREPLIKSPDNPIMLDKVKGDIEFANVSFAYPTRSSSNIFEDLNLRIPSGSVVAVVGASGSGKSTIISLLARLYDPTQGQVLLDGENIKKFQLDWLRKNIGFVSQEPVLFSGTIRENISYGLDSPTTWVSEEEQRNFLSSPEIDAQIRFAAEQANADKFIEEFPDGYDTQIGERGITLSGGQKQRIAIARAIIKNPKILVLDEATSALDAASEYAVQQALESLMKDRTTLIVAHRLSTVKKANTIVVLNEGKIAEQGTHSELMNNKSIYCNLISRQMAQ